MTMDCTANLQSWPGSGTIFPMSSNERPRLRPAAASAAIALTAASAIFMGCGSNALPQVPVPRNDEQAALPGWYPERPWSAKDGETRIYIEGKIVFDTGKDTIRTAQSEQVLKTLLQFIVTHPEVTLVRIEGHTDDRGSDEMNQDLSARRSLRVCDWLVDNGIDNTRLLAVGFGKTRPIAPNKGAAQMQENRRTEFHVAEVNGRPFVIKDPANGGYALIVKSAEQRRLERVAALHPPAPPALKPFVPEGDVVKPVDVNKILRAQAKDREKKERMKGPQGGGDDGG
jgi:outer membrane protein OmpA-like peptidoglycan-associated protein